MQTIAQFRTRADRHKAPAFSFSGWRAGPVCVMMIKNSLGTGVCGMDNLVLVRAAAEIPAAVALAERYAAAATESAGARICPLICEELLLRLLRMGCTEIRVSLRGRPFRHIEIRAAGERTDVPDAAPDTGADGIDTQISGCILEQYMSFFSFRYQGGVNVYRVFARKGEAVDLTEDIYAYYQDADPDGAQKPLAVLRYIARSHRGFFALSVIILLVKHLGGLLLPVFVSNIINIVTDTGSFFVRPVLTNILASVLALAVNLICYWLDSRCYRRFTRAVEAGFRMALVQKLQALSMRFHSETQSGVVLSKVASDVQFIQTLIYDRFMEILYLGEDVLFIIAVALSTFPLMLVFYLVIVPMVVYLVRRFSKPLQDRRARMRRQNEQVNAAVKEMLEMESLTRAHGLERTEYRDILTKVRGAQRAAVAYDRETVIVNNLTYGGFQGLRLLSLSLAALLMAGGHISVGTLVLFQSIFDLIIANVQRLLDAVPLITQGYDSLVSVNEILYASDVERNGSARLPGPMRGEITFSHVSFGYEPDKPPVLDDVSFTVPAGGSAAFVGKSGEGKTTILNLILGLYGTQSGDILIDGVNLDELEKEAYRRNIAVVPQQSVLFSGTLWDNLVYGLNYVSAEQVMDVIRRVGLEDLIASLPEGLNAPILENGGNLSGGQRQRISIARALLRNPKLILLDEATSALDSESERQVQKAIDAIMGSCTVIMVAHRLGTLRRADTIYRLEGGVLRRYDEFEQVIQDMDGGEST